MELFQRENELFGVYTKDPAQQQELQQEWGVSMSEMKLKYYQYYQHQKTREKDVLFQVDPVWFHSIMKDQS